MRKIIVINPRATHFCDSRATSIDLCVRDLVHYSRYVSTTTVIGDAVERSFAGIRFLPRPVTKPDTFLIRAPKLLQMVRELRPDLVCVQEHLRTAAYFAKRIPVPVLLQKHNAVRASRGMLDRLMTAADYNRLAAVIFVSQSQREDFRQAWPNVRAPLLYVTNSIDASLWKPSATRSQTILVVGRAIPSKGIRQAALAIAEILTQYPDWRASFILNEVEADPGYFQQISSLVDRMGAQASLSVQRPLADVKLAMEQSAIIIVPSVVRETFGRVALEAHAAGLAVISSGAGGLREVSGDAALYLPAVEPLHIANALDQLIADPAQRNALASKGRARAVEMFDVRSVAAKCDDIYERLILGSSIEDLNSVSIGERILQENQAPFADSH